MRKKILKIGVILVLILSMTMVNFTFVATSIYSYAAENIATNNRNVEFNSYLEDENTLVLQVNVKQEGYFNGKVSLENTNFVLKNSESEYINNIEGNEITLNQINAGTSAQMKIEIEPIKPENYNAGLLSVESELTLTGIYRDSSERDRQINATKTVTLEIKENNTIENVENTIEVITNKIATVNGEEKRVIQFSINLGLKENNYPIREIISEISVPEINGERPEIVNVANLNTMSTYAYNYDNQKVTLTLRNEPSAEGNILWKTEGNENIVLTYIYDKDTDLTNNEITSNEKIKLYNDKELSTQAEVQINNEEKDNIVQISTKYEEDSIYKGKIKAGIKRDIVENTEIAVNLASAVTKINLTENTSTYIANGQEISANITYTQTKINKEKFVTIFGQNGVMTIKSQNDEILATVDNSTTVDEEGNIIVNYEQSKPTSLKIETTQAVTEGKLEIENIKTIEATDTNIIRTATNIKTIVSENYNSEVATQKQEEAIVELKETVTEAKLEINKESLSTVIANNVEIKAILKGNSEEYDLYRNPYLEITLPEDVESIEINSIDLIYETELRIRNYTVEGRTIRVYLEGTQTQYKETAVEGATIVIGTTINVNNKAATKDSSIQLAYQNENATSYVENGVISSAIRIVAPKDVTALYSIPELSVETMGQESNTQVMLEKGVETRQVTENIEIINNNENTINNVAILGTFATDNEQNNINARVVEPLQLSKEAKIYYTENENATADLENTENAWTEDITDLNKVQKYLIVVDQLQTQESIEGTYKTEIPENLEYNQTAKEVYAVTYSDSATQVQNTVRSTEIELQTGIGPKIDTSLTATLGGTRVSANTRVKNGEVIKYTVQVANTGTEDINDITVNATIPEGAILVEPEENYEYTGASYYNEIEGNFETTIASIKVGETTNVVYEVRVKNDTAEGTTLTSRATVKYGEAVQETDGVTVTTEQGDIRVTVKRITDRNVDLYTSGTVQYFAIIENISNEQQNNIRIQTQLSDNLDVELLTKYTGMTKVDTSDLQPTEPEEFTGTVNTTAQLESAENTNIVAEPLQYSQEVNIGNIRPGENIVLAYDLLIKNQAEEQKEIEFAVKAIDGNKTYESNIGISEVKDFAISLEMSSNTESRYVKSGDKIIYTIEVKNESESATSGLVIRDSLPKALTIERITVDGTELTGYESNNISVIFEVEGNSTTTIRIETIVDYSETRTEAEAITNIAYAEIFGERVGSTQEVSHIIEASSSNSEEGDNNVDDNDVAEGNRTIEGIAWFDTNTNGRKDPEETTLNNITVKLLNAETNHLVKDKNGNELTVQTNDNGVYMLNNIGNGKYIVIFEYDTARYTVTRYRAEGVAETQNSNAMKNQLLINGETAEVSSTDIINIENENISDINVGLIELENFDLKLDKYVSRILIQNASGTRVTEYTDTTMAKIELDARQVSGTTVIIEYSIKVSNVGEISGYAKRIADYIPNDLKFSSELNKDWYQTGDTLYNASIANEEIAAGESKTLTLTLTKTMTENNTGLINNTAEIVEDYNELEIKDSNSTPGNRTQGENDMGSADTIISIRTGGIVYFTIAIVVIATLVTVAVIVIKRKKQTGEI